MVVVVVVVVVQFLSGLVSLNELTVFIAFLLQFFALHLATSLDSVHLSSLNQSSLSPPPFLLLATGSGRCSISRTNDKGLKLAMAVSQ